MKKRNKGPKGIGGWLLVILISCILSAISNLPVLIQKIVALAAQFRIGVLISAALLLIYEIFIWMTISGIFKKKKLAIKWYLYSFIAGALFVIWYYLVSWFIYYPDKTMQIIQNFIIVFVNIIITFLILKYFLKSKRVKNTLVN